MDTHIAQKVLFGNQVCQGNNGGWRKTQWRQKFQLALYTMTAVCFALGLLQHAGVRQSSNHVWFGCSCHSQLPRFHGHINQI